MRRKYMPSVGFEPEIPAIERAQAYALTSFSTSGAVVRCCRWPHSQSVNVMDVHEEFHKITLLHNRTYKKINKFLAQCLASIHFFLVHFC
jgi:hypothetical protein